ncbi:Acyl carrier protein [Paenibacillus allorhizoplanae]|uniref:Acyl carrier protein n=1 Tax=Paenibacillus allorhizoplanae TaxID=2905648 RepID=A0ABN8H0W3_9BACL|nr:acyl carrier protein [Paenibacillus allorhizoplanae]CAH1221521.1 Acyl carrier protein [Paenibacillus allorhizoplanae]
MSRHQQLSTHKAQEKSHIPNITPPSKSSPFSPMAGHIQTLQRTIGNQAVQRMVESATSSSIQRKVIDIIIEHLDFNESFVTPSSSFVDDLAVDELSMTEIVVAFEEEFGIKIPDEQAERFRTVKDAISFIAFRSK